MLKASCFWCHVTRSSKAQLCVFTPADLSVLLPENLGNRAIGTERRLRPRKVLTAGGGTGAVLGGTPGLACGIGALAIPGVGPLIAAARLCYVAE